VLFSCLANTAFAQDEKPGLSCSGNSISLKLGGTDRLPGATGTAVITQAGGVDGIQAEVKGMKPATLFGGDYNTYVLWLLSPRGETENAGEFVLHGDRSELNASTELCTYSMFVTAEPHYLVGAPSRFVVLDDRGLSESARVVYREYEGNYNFERDTLGDCKKAGGIVHTGLQQAYTAVRLALRAGARDLATDELMEAHQALQAANEIARDRRRLQEADRKARQAVWLAIAAERLAQERAMDRTLVR
jgi:hypothetical protein